MKKIKFKNFKRSLNKSLKKVIIPFVDETTYLLSNKSNSQHLFKSIEQVRKNRRK